MTEKGKDEKGHDDMEKGQDDMTIPARGRPCCHMTRRKDTIT